MKLVGKMHDEKNIPVLFKKISGKIQTASNTRDEPPTCVLQCYEAGHSAICPFSPESLLVKCAEGGNRTHLPHSTISAAQGMKTNEVGEKQLFLLKSKYVVTSIVYVNPRQGKVLTGYPLPVYLKITEKVQLLLPSNIKIFVALM